MSFFIYNVKAFQTVNTFKGSKINKLVSETNAEALIIVSKFYVLCPPLIFEYIFFILYKRFL